MFLTVAGAYAVLFCYSPPERLAGPLTEPVRITHVDIGTGQFTIARTLKFYVTRVVLVEQNGGRMVKARVGTEDVREVSESYTVKHWRLTDKQGADFDWAKAKGKTVILFRSNRLPEKEVLALMAKKTVILYGN
ncbi:hypothetical protein [Limnoglobus roseus]|uniref:Uncharacterized protein n=1 Tax=Limnoglobus roseus TaxID=2598579 RepID=A0A5C1AN05_9BACT|nr:hypothetical protein [Limnoglobus roseus]QEL19955.1 hypothetical protein PX52LOC_07038 [Limnoglobus roseus]